MLLCISADDPTEPITIDELKDMLRIDDTVFDAQLPGLLSAAREVIERQTGVALVAADYEWTPDGDRRTPLPLVPATITSEQNDYPVLLSTVAPVCVPRALKIAIVLLVGEMIKNPEATVSKDMVENPAFQRLVWPYRRVQA